MLYVLPNMNDLIELHNKSRTGGWFKKIKPLIKNEELMLYAQKWADEMASKSLLVHSSMGDIMRLGFSSAAENIAYGQPDVEGVMDTWLRSIGHRRNIMNKSYDSIGCCFAYSDRDVIYWCVCFGKEK